GHSFSIRCRWGLASGVRARYSGPAMSESTERQSTEAELIAVRREKLGKLRELGVNPFGSAFETTHTPAGLREAFSEGLYVKVAGRIKGWRNMGRSCFFHIGD